MAYALPNEPPPQCHGLFIVCTHAHTPQGFSNQANHLKIAFMCKSCAFFFLLLLLLLFLEFGSEKKRVVSTYILINQSSYWFIISCCTCSRASCGPDLTQAVAPDFEPDLCVRACSGPSTAVQTPVHV